jgi:hypothetical protein
MPSIHRLRRGLLGYLIPFAPHAFVSQCQVCSSKLPSPLVFLPILTHFTTTPAIPLTSPNLNPASFSGCSTVERWALTEDLCRTPTDALRPINPDNARGLCITAAAGTELAAPYSYGTVIVLPIEK